MNDVKKAVQTLKDYANEILKEFRAVNDKFHNDIEKHRFDADTTEYRRIQYEYQRWIETNVIDNGFTYSYRPDGSEIISLEMKLAH